MDKVKLIGRDQEKGKMEEALDKMIKGDFSLSILVGKLGTGKSFLVSQIEPLFYENKCSYIKVKVSPSKEEMDTAALEILNEVIKQLLVLEEEDFVRVKKRLKKRLAKEEKILLALSDFAGHIFPDSSAGSDASARLPLEKIKPDRILAALSAFIREASLILHPMVLFIDDCHYGDPLTSRLIKALSEGTKAADFYLILALRDGYNKELDGFLRAREKITLGGLSEENIGELLEDSWPLAGDALRTLGSLFFALTKGNPFYLRFLLAKTKEDKLLRAGERACQLDLEKFRQMTLSKGIELILEEEIRKSSRAEWELLLLVSRFGASVSEDMLRAFYPGRTDLFEDTVKLLAGKSLLLKIEKEGQASYSLAHELLGRVISGSEGAEDGLGPYNMARVLAEAGFADSRPVTVAGFLLEASRKDRAGLEKSEKSENSEKGAGLWIDTLYRAGKRSQEKGDIRYALSLYGLAKDLIEKEGPDKKTRKYLEFYLAYLKCLFVNEKKKEADALYHRLLDDFSSEEEVLKVKMVYIYCYAYEADWEKVLSLGLEILKFLNYRLRTATISADLLLCRMIYSRRRIDKIVDGPTITDQRILRIQEILIIIFPAANRIDKKLFNLINIKLALIAGRYGNSPYSAVGYAAYAYILSFVFADYKQASILQKKTVDLLDDPSRHMHRSIAYALLGTFTYHWTHPFQETLSCLDKSMAASEVEEEYLYTNYAFVFSVITMYVMGRPLGQIKERIKTNSLREGRLESYLTYYMSGIYLAHIQGLKEGSRHVDHLQGLDKQSFSQTINLNADMIDLHRLYLEGKTRQAYELAKANDALVAEHRGFILNGHYTLFSALSRISAQPLLSKEEATLNHKRVKKQLKSLKLWKERNPLSQGPGYYLAQAEYNYFYQDKKDDCQGLYSRAIIGAQKENNIPLEALANLLAARHADLSPQNRLLFASEALRLFRRWGAYQIADLVRREFDLTKDQSLADLPPDRFVGERDILEGLSQLAAKELQASFLYLLDYLVDYQYCDNVYVFLEHQGEMNLKYQRTPHAKGVYYKAGIHLNYVEGLPHKVIRYVARTEEAVLLDGKEEASSLLAACDNPLSEDGSLLTLPLKKMGILSGILLMEKKGPFEADIKERLAFLYGLVDPVKEEKKSVKKKKARGQGEGLTEREREILSQVGKGMSNSQISDMLFIAEGTVRNHLSKIYAKLNVESRVQAVIAGNERDLI